MPNLLVIPVKSRRDVYTKSVILFFTAVSQPLVPKFFKTVLDSKSGNFPPREKEDQMSVKDSLSYTVYFIDDIGDATEISDHLNTYEQAQEWERVTGTITLS